MQTVVPLLEEVVAEMGMELVRSARCTERAFVTLPGMPWDRIDEYHWPRRANGTKRDKRVYATVFHDGSYSLCLQVESTDLRHAAAA